MMRATTRTKNSSKNIACGANTKHPNITIDLIPGALDHVGLFDPLGFSDKADEATLKRYREAELTHGRVPMLAAVGFLVGEAVEVPSFLF
jgi:hypothetical protein